MKYPTKPLKGAAVKDLEFLTGHWKGNEGDDTIEEFWLPEDHSNKACVFRWIKDGDIYIYEIVALIERDNEIHMLLRHFDKMFNSWEDKQSPRDFVVTEISDTQVIFIDTKKPDSGFLRYDVSNPKKLEFFDHEPDGSVNFSLTFSKVE